MFGGRSMTFEVQVGLYSGLFKIFCVHNIARGGLWLLVTTGVWWRGTLRFLDAARFGGRGELKIWLGLF